MAMQLIPPTGGPGRGLFPQRTGPIVCTNDTGGAVIAGDLVMFDPGATTDSATPGNASRYEMAQKVATAGLDRAIFAVVTEGGAVGAVIKVVLSGRVTITTGGSVSAGDACTGVNAAYTVAAGTVGGAKVIAIAEADDDAASGPFLFDGVYGFGTVNTTS